MATVIGDLLPLAVVVAISPIPVAATILMLLAPRATAASGGFLLGWVAGIVVGTVAFTVIASTAGLSESGGRSTTGSWIRTRPNACTKPPVSMPRRSCAQHFSPWAANATPKPAQAPMTTATRAADSSQQAVAPAKKPQKAASGHSHRREQAVPPPRPEPVSPFANSPFGRLFGLSQ